MKQLLRCFFVLLLLFPAAFFAQNKEEELLEWDYSRKLTWDDYKGNPNPESDAAASTTTLLAIEYKISSNGFRYKIDSRFSKTRSWGIHKTDYILSHEQGHFDIAEIYARKLNMKMSEYKFNTKTYQKDLKKIYQDILDEKEEVQNAYDGETRHSINKAKQAEWLKIIAKMLEEYEDYADY